MSSDLADIDIANLSDAALQAASGAQHADVRLMSTRTGYQTYRDTSAVADMDHCAIGLGVRVLRNGCWGFAATTSLDADAAAAAARDALEMARATAPATSEEVSLAGASSAQGSWSSKFQIDPFDVPASDRMSFLEQGCSDLIASNSVQRVNATSMAVREEVAYADNAGTRIQQQRIRVHADFTAVSIADDGTFETMRTTAPPVGRGWEYLTRPGSSESGGWDWSGELEALPERLEEKTQAPSVEPGEYTLVIDPTNLWLTIHESIGHATELDRVKGYEANYAGTSFASQDQLGSLQYGSPLLNITGDRTTPHGLATVAWDDEGVTAQEWPIIDEGILVDYQLDRVSICGPRPSTENSRTFLPFRMKSLSPLPPN